VVLRRDPCVDHHDARRHALLQPARYGHARRVIAAKLVPDAEHSHLSPSA
jgi:hypothetical protein